MINVLKIPIHDQGLGAAVRGLVATCVDERAPRRNRLVSATGAHGLVHARKHPEFAELLRTFTINLPDGKPTEWIGRIKGGRAMRQCRGADFFREVIRESAAHPIRHFLCGGQEGVADELARVCRDRLANANVVGTYCPPFREMTDDELSALAAQIDEARTDVLWVGLSTPKQERFAARLATHVRVHYIATIGAAFDF